MSPIHYFPGNWNVWYPSKNCIDVLCSTIFLKCWHVAILYEIDLWSSQSRNRLHSLTTNHLNWVLVAENVFCSYWETKLFVDHNWPKKTCKEKNVAFWCYYSHIYAKNWSWGLLNFIKFLLYPNGYHKFKLTSWPPEKYEHLIVKTKWHLFFCQTRAHFDIHKAKNWKICVSGTTLVQVIA